MSARVPRGLYAITSQAICAEPAQLLAAVEAALAGGAVMVQYRDKWSDPAGRVANARALAALCKRHGAPLIINDDPQLAADCGADGVHLGASDAPLAQARQLLGAQAIIGVTCSNSLERAQRAAAGGADYVAFGRFFPSRTKPDAPQAMPELLPQARAILSGLPLCAIGGITPDNGAALVAAGASLLAVVDAVFGASDVSAAASRFELCFRP